MQIMHFVYACFKNLAINNRKKNKIKSVLSKIIIGRLKFYSETLQLQLILESEFGKVFYPLKLTHQD